MPQSSGTSTDDDPPVREATREEGRILLDREARRLLGISGEEFLANLDAGQYEGISEDDDIGRGVIQLWYLIPFARPHDPDGELGGAQPSASRHLGPPAAATASVGGSAMTQPHFEDDDIVPFHEITIEEGQAILDREAHELLGISGEEFLRNIDAGVYQDVDERDQFGRNVVRLWFLIPLARDLDDGRQSGA